MLIPAPSALVLHDAIANIRKPTSRKILEWLLLTIGGTSLTFVVFYQTALPLLFLIPPIVIAHAFRLGALGTAFSVMKVAVIALIFTQAGKGPINLLPVPDDVQMLMLEAFLATSMVVGLPVAARDRVSAELAAGRQRLALLADNVTDAILRYDIDWCCTYASPSVETVLGLPPGDFIGRSSSEQVHPDAQAAVEDVEEALLTGKKDKERSPIGAISTLPTGAQSSSRRIAQSPTMARPAIVRGSSYPRAMSPTALSWSANSNGPRRMRRMLPGQSRNSSRI